MRHLLLLLLIACNDDGAPNKGGADDTDLDTDPAETDEGPIVYTEVDPIVRFNPGEFEGVIISSHIPADAKALVFLFHGTGGGARNMTETTEMIYILNHMIPRGIGFLAVDSINQEDGLFDVSTRAANNADFQLHTRMRDQLVSEGAITAETPIFALGFSAGGGYTSYFGHAGLDAGWPMGGLLFHNAGGRSSEYGGPPPLPCMWLATENDDKVEFAGVEAIYQEHVDDGNVGVWGPIAEIPLYPTRFVRTGDFSVEQSQQVFDEAVRGGFFDEQGTRLFEVAEIPQKVSEFTNNYDVIYPKPVTAQLNVVLASHAINGARAEEEAAFVEAHAAR
jgi:dienelactone hydrolase